MRLSSTSLLPCSVERPARLGSTLATMPRSNVKPGSERADSMADRTNRPAAEKKARIRKSTECTGLRAKTTANPATTVITAIR